MTVVVISTKSEVDLLRPHHDRDVLKGQASNKYLNCFEATKM